MNRRYLFLWVLVVRRCAHAVVTSTTKQIRLMFNNERNGVYLQQHAVMACIQSYGAYGVTSRIANLSSDGIVVIDTPSRYPWQLLGIFHATYL